MRMNGFFSGFDIFSALGRIVLFFWQVNRFIAHRLRKNKMVG
jgi:hypothetical protein